MHPPKDKMKLLVDRALPEKEAAEIERHLKECEFCREFAGSYRLWRQSEREAAATPSSAKTDELADRLFVESLGGRIIELHPLPGESGALLLAADGRTGESAKVRHLATLCSEEPELVMRLMRDLEAGCDYLQLIAEDANLARGVMVQLPELKRQFITDTTGRAVLEGISLEKPDDLKWQIKMPDMIFDLEPLKYDPEKVEYSSETVLETSGQDRIKVTFEGRTEGKQITIRILELDGSTDFESVRVAVTQDENTQSATAEPDKTLIFESIDARLPINIRLFT